MWTLFSRHPDAHIPELLAGTLEARVRSRVLRHLHRCPRCEARYERLVHAERMLAHDHRDALAPSELSLLRESHLAAALASAEPLPGPRRGLWLGLAGTLAAGAVAVTLFLQPQEEVWTARGSGQPQAVLRVFCARPSGELVELRGASSCPRDGQLAFAVSAEARPMQVMVSVRGEGLDFTRGPFPVDAPPGREAPLKLTLPLDSVVGARVEVVASFAPLAEQARAGLRGASPDGVVLRKQVPVSSSR
ncbi:zf-HC2 domain-containing protein [Vitiosangium sp. GDMCC 1.1324]|uniref:zf-HC2 domain-containing protein n=1 Tax=Vitiosangium sp. (strain GDMCC 1.1324) TaxID=2138576 RepID=UPI000D3CCAA2|nr:zf-HC2 domain-containing protein [Vitiosangium sp. GDMCC 1.1324]PTL80331.1 hypothetical protein DAT35_30585 [Vitiosangium sp. GDMCC 1.1324]